MSLDGYATGPDDRVGQPLGRGSGVLFAWYGEPQPEAEPDKPTGDEDTDRAVAELGALICGRHGYEVAGGWGDEPMFRCPVFVLTHTPREPVVKGATTFTFVTDGFDAAMAGAQEAPADKTVGLHGPGVIQQGINAGVLERLRVDVVPALLGGGKPLFDGITRADVRVEIVDVKPGTGVTHLTYRFS